MRLIGKTGSVCRVLENAAFGNDSSCIGTQASHALGTLVLNAIAGVRRHFYRAADDAFMSNT
jgi:hypothetical protein